MLQEILMKYQCAAIVRKIITSRGVFESVGRLAVALHNECDNALSTLSGFSRFFEKVIVESRQQEVQNNYPRTSVMSTFGSDIIFVRNLLRQ